MRAKRTGMKEIEIGDRVCFTIPYRGGWGYGFGDCIKLNRKSVVVIDKKFPGNEEIRVSRELVYKVTAQQDVIKLDKEESNHDSNC